ncbi:CoA transferase [Pseudonocardia sp. RS010]|uniref:CoA transferase n=1 Tax=Pseudonocardia sp. RS010 TaxID=3385979 RepID=UPI0039A3368F
MDPRRQRDRNPRLVYGQITGYGLGPAQDVASYDHGAFWSASGLAALYADGDGVPPQPAGGMGDRATGTALAGAIAAALFRRERTGVGEHVTGSLLRTAMWLMASDVADALREPEGERVNDRTRAPVPTVNCFRCADGRWLWLQCMLPDRMWSALLTALDAHWLDDDSRFRSGDRRSLAKAGPALVEALDELFRQRTLSEWSARLTAAGVPFAPVRSLGEAVADPGTATAGAFLEMEHAGTRYRTVNTPCTFEGTPAAARTASPGVGQHTREVLAELGVPAAEIEALDRATAATV